MKVLQEPESTTAEPSEAPAPRTGKPRRGTTRKPKAQAQKPDQRTAPRDAHRKPNEACPKVPMRRARRRTRPVKAHLLPRYDATFWVCIFIIVGYVLVCLSQTANGAGSQVFAALQPAVASILSFLLGRFSR
jgi:hypothetical protein